MPAKRTVAVLGPIPRDRVITHRDETFDKYGCVLYTAAAMATLLGDGGTVYPIVHVSKEDEEPISQLLSAFPNIDLTGLRSATDRGDVVELRYVDQNTRIERQTGFMSPILPQDVEFALDADAFVCVPITDYEVPRGTLEFIRARSTGTIILDAHGPTVALGPGGERRARLWVERDSWLPSIDILKMNLEEAGRSWFEADTPATGAVDERVWVALLAEHCLHQGVQAVCVTLDANGCLAYRLGPGGQLDGHYVPAVPVDDVVDTTGCGDSFAAGLAFGYLGHGDILAACQYGNALGAQRCAGRELAIYRSLPETQAQIVDAYAQRSVVQA